MDLNVYIHARCTSIYFLSIFISDHRHQFIGSGFGMRRRRHRWFAVHDAPVNRNGTGSRARSDAIVRFSRRSRRQLQSGAALLVNGSARSRARHEWRHEWRHHDLPAWRRVCVEREFHARHTRFRNERSSRDLPGLPRRDAGVQRRHSCLRLVLVRRRQKYLPCARPGRPAHASDVCQRRARAAC